MGGFIRIPCRSHEKVGTCMLFLVYAIAKEGKVGF
mgnify:CR=1 FL=1